VANPTLLGQRGAVVLLDIAKVFHTIDRTFLLPITELCGGGPGMRRWIRRLLQHMSATTGIRGRAAAPLLWLVGVRQGRPLSPLIQLFVAEASSRWLTVLWELCCRKCMVSFQKADDGKV
jgi:hypothetical protein